jgi:hypothetical protein
LVERSDDDFRIIQDACSPLHKVDEPVRLNIWLLRTYVSARAESNPQRPIPLSTDRQIAPPGHRFQDNGRTLGGPRRVFRAKRDLIAGDRNFGRRIRELVQLVSELERTLHRRVAFLNIFLALERDPQD